MIGKPKFGTLSQYLATHPMLMYEKWEWEGNPPPQTTISNDIGIFITLWVQ